MYHYYNLYHHHHHHHSCHSSSSSSSSLSPSFVIVVVIIVVVVVVIYISIDRVFFLLLPSLFISDRHYDFFVLFHVHLSSRPNFKISTCLFLFFFFSQRSNVSSPCFPLFFFRRFFTRSFPLSPPPSRQNYVTLHIAQFSIHSHFSFNHVSFIVFRFFLRTYVLFHRFFEYFSLSSPYLTNAPLTLFFNFFSQASYVPLLGC